MLFYRQGHRSGNSDFVIVRLVPPYGLVTSLISILEISRELTSMLMKRISQEHKTAVVE
jgi:hypothetical protein